jgi:hypothetical protein
MVCLQHLHLAKCGLVGPCPLAIADAQELRTLNLADNPDLDGELPSSLAELHWLQVRRRAASQRSALGARAARV